MGILWGVQVTSLTEVDANCNSPVVSNVACFFPNLNELSIFGKSEQLSNHSGLDFNLIPLKQPILTLAQRDMKLLKKKTNPSLFFHHLASLFSHTSEGMLLQMRNIRAFKWDLY